MIVPGALISWITFPGVIVHEFGHFLFCRLRRIAVYDAVFFRLGNPAGYVVHGNSPDFLSTFLICVGPLIVNTLLCLFICLPAYIPFKVFGQNFDRLSNVGFAAAFGILLNYLVLWLGVSIGMHAFPSTQDAMNLWQAAKQRAGSGDILAVLSLPLAALIFVANLLRFFWFDYIFGLAVGLGIPSLIL